MATAQCLCPSDKKTVAVTEGYATQDGTDSLVVLGRNNAAFKCPFELDVRRAGTTAVGYVKGVKLPSLNGPPGDTDQTGEGRRILGSDDLQSGTGRSYFYVDIAFVTISGQNWICLFYDQSAGTFTALTLASSATTSDGEFFVETYDSGNQIKLTIGGSTSGGWVTDYDVIEIYYVGTPTTILTITADAAGQFMCEEVASGYDVIWFQMADTSSPSATTVYARALNH